MDKERADVFPLMTWAQTIRNLIVAVIIGFLVGVAYPSFLAYPTKAKQSLAKSMLRSIAQAQEAHHQQHGRYAPSFNALVWESKDGRDIGYMPYSFFLPEEQWGVGHPRITWEQDGGWNMALPHGYDPVVTETRFLCVAVGNLDRDSDLDMWTISETGIPENVQDDVPPVNAMGGFVAYSLMTFFPLALITWFRAKRRRKQDAARAMQSPGDE